MTMGTYALLPETITKLMLSESSTLFDILVSNQDFQSLIYAKFCFYINYANGNYHIYHGNQMINIKTFIHNIFSDVQIRAFFDSCSILCPLEYPTYCESNTDTGIETIVPVTPYDDFTSNAKLGPILWSCIYWRIKSFPSSCMEKIYKHCQTDGLKKISDSIEYWKSSNSPYVHNIVQIYIIMVVLHYTIETPIDKFGEQEIFKKNYVDYLKSIVQPHILQMTLKFVLKTCCKNVNNFTKFLAFSIIFDLAYNQELMESKPLENYTDLWEYKYVAYYGSINYLITKKACVGPNLNIGKLLNEVLTYDTVNIYAYLYTNKFFYESNGVQMRHMEILGYSGEYISPYAINIFTYVYESLKDSQKEIMCSHIFKMRYFHLVECLFGMGDPKIYHALNHTMENIVTVIASVRIPNKFAKNENSDNNFLQKTNWLFEPYVLTKSMLLTPNEKCLVGLYFDISQLVESNIEYLQPMGLKKFVCKMLDLECPRSIEKICMKMRMLNIAIDLNYHQVSEVTRKVFKYPTIGCLKIMSICKVISVDTLWNFALCWNDITWLSDVLEKQMFFNNSVFAIKAIVRKKPEIFKNITDKQFIIQNYDLLHSSAIRYRSVRCKILIEMVRQQRSNINTSTWIGTRR